LEDINKSLNLLRDGVRQGKGILNLVVQAPHEGGTFYRIVPLNVGSIVLEFFLIGGEVTVCLLEYLQFLFCCHQIIWVPKCHFQNRDQGWDICEIDPFIDDIGLDLCEGLVHQESKGISELVLGIRETGGIACQFYMQVVDNNQSLSLRPSNFSGSGMDTS
jgi:hypothetical protein